MFTLAIVWRIAIPYFRSEDRWAGRVLLAAVILIELGLVSINVLLNQWNNRFYNALQERNWDAFIARSAPNTQPPKLSRGSMIYTSGTTGRPKGAELTHGNLRRNAARRGQVPNISS
jgi:acyl-CoA synthetase (AMP-forming)/AMP-acid ligase II